MANNSAVTDIGFLSPEWLQDSFNSPELDASLKPNYHFSWMNLAYLHLQLHPYPVQKKAGHCLQLWWVGSYGVCRAKSTHKNTVNSTKMWVNWFEVWQKVWGVTVPSDPDPHQLDVILKQLYAELRKEDSNEYEPNSLATCIGIFRRKDFLKAFEIGAEQKCDWIMWGSGSGRTKCRLTEEDEEMWSSWVLGERAWQVSTTLCSIYVLRQHFGWMVVRSTTRCELKF